MLYIESVCDRAAVLHNPVDRSWPPLLTVLDGFFQKGGPAAAGLRYIIPGLVTVDWGGPPSKTFTHQRG